MTANHIKKITQLNSNALILQIDFSLAVSINPLSKQQETAHSHSNDSLHREKCDNVIGVLG
jgi:hypothetical protein